MKAILLFLSLIVTIFSFGQQPTVGLRLSSNQSSDGYTLFTPEKNKFVYLIDNCGQVVNTWEFSENPALTCYLLENGNLLRAGLDSLEIRDWDNQLVWSYSNTANGFPQHHDIEPLPNGNILLVSKESFNATELLELGRNPALGSANFALDVIYELKPLGTNDAQLVWEWRFSDHLIQEFDNTKSNYGIVSDFPELLDVNFDNAQTSDYTHVNAIDYSAELDQILITARHLSELYVVDHSTSMIEAASHSGGAKGKGGDFLYRWGNPQVYQSGLASDQLIRLPHDGKWVNQGCPNYGQMTVFSNGGDGVSPMSSVHVFKPTIVGGVYQMNNNMFLPADHSWSWSGAVLGSTLYESKKCGMMELKNGNHLVCETSTGTLFEIGLNDEIVWVYKNPTGSNGYIYQQDESLPASSNTLFRGERYDTDFVGFIGKDLTPMGTIETSNTESANCLISAGLEEQLIVTFQVQNPVTSNKLNFAGIVEIDELALVNLNGQIQKQVLNFIGQSLELNCSPGVYFLNIKKGNNYSTQKIILF